MRSCKEMLLVFCAAAAVSAAPGAAIAGGPEENARTRMAEARRLRSAGNCADAIVWFRRTLDLHAEDLEALRGAAECEEELGRYAAARQDWWDLRRAVSRSIDAKFAGWSDEAEAHHESLADKVGKFTIRVQGAKKDTQFEVFLDGKALDPQMLGTALERDIGPHTVELDYGTKAPLTRKFDLKAGQKLIVPVTIPSAEIELPAPAPAPVTAKPPRPPEPPRPPDWHRRTAYVFFGGSVTTAVAAAIAFAVRGSRSTATDPICTHEPQITAKCPTDYVRDVNIGTAAARLTNLLTFFAVVSFGTGLVLLATEPPAPRDDATNRGAEISITPTFAGASANLSMRF